MTITRCSHGAWEAGEFGDELSPQLVFKVVLELSCLMHRHRFYRNNKAIDIREREHGGVGDRES